MIKAINDATPAKIGDIFQYYIALRDCFKMSSDDKLQIEVHGDVSLIADESKNSFQREVKHHFGSKTLTDRDVDFWKTLSNWYVDYDRIAIFSSLILHTTAIIAPSSSFCNWNEQSPKEKITALQSIGKKIKSREKEFRMYYNKIFAIEIYDEKKLTNIVNKFTIEHSQKNISGISEEFNCYIGHIPERNRDNYIAALLGQILSIVKDPPHRWEVTRSEFDKILQQESPAHANPKEIPLPTDYAETDIPKNEEKALLSKRFVEAIRKIEFEEQVPSAISDYWKVGMTIGRYFYNDFLYLNSLPLYRKELTTRLGYVKDRNIIKTSGMDKNGKIEQSKIMYLDVMSWEAKDFGSIVRNQGYFQRGIIHTIVDGEKFNWDVGDKNEH